MEIILIQNHILKTSKLQISFIVYMHWFDHTV